MSTIDGDSNIEALHDKAHILWHISDYFSNQRTDNYYNSQDFHFLGSTWSIRIYPNGQRFNQTVEYVGLYIMQEEKNKARDVYFKIGIVCGETQLWEKRGPYYSYGYNRTSWAKFLERRILTSNRFRVAPQGTLTIRLVGTALRNGVLHNEKESQTKVLDGMNVLTRDLQTLLSSGETSDVSIRVKSRVFPAHKVILVARSTVFAAMFRYDMKEKITGSIDIEDCEPSAFQEFLTFMYTGRMDNLSLENVFDILFLANKYDLSDLKQICIDFMEENLCLDMVCNVFCVADKFNLVDLKKSAKELFRKNKNSVMLTENWISFIRENPQLATEILMEAFP